MSPAAPELKQELLHAEMLRAPPEKMPSPACDDFELSLVALKQMMSPMCDGSKPLLVGSEPMPSLAASETEQDPSHVLSEQMPLPQRRGPSRIRHLRRQSTCCFPWYL